MTVSDTDGTVEGCLFELQCILGDLEALRSGYLRRFNAENGKLNKCCDVVRDCMGMLQARLDGKGAGQ